MHENICECPLQKYGTTKNYEDAGFIMPNGAMVNFTERINNIVVHRHSHVEIAAACYPPKEAMSKIDCRWRWMEECKAIRISLTDDGRMHIESRTPPTSKQMERLIESVNYSNRLTATANKCPLIGKGEDCYCDYIIDNPRPQDIHRWINKCWR